MGRGITFLFRGKVQAKLRSVAVWTSGVVRRKVHRTARFLVQLEIGRHLRFFFVTKDVEVVVSNGGLFSRYQVGEKLS